METRSEKKREKNSIDKVHWTWLTKMRKVNETVSYEVVGVITFNLEHRKPSRDPIY